MKNWEQSLIAPASSLREALAIIDKLGSQMALVVDGERRLLGTLSDGDIRRGLLRGMSLDDQVNSAMFVKPTVALESDDRAIIVSRMRDLKFHQMPIVSALGVVVGMAVSDDFLNAPLRDSWVIVMAGGPGTRLEHLTRDTPKPMLRVGSSPILETMLRGFSAQGFHKFYFAVNYKAEKIERYFSDGKEFGVVIRYLREEQRLGTAGPLSLLPEIPARPVVVTNADLLTKVDCGALLDEHVRSGADATMAVRQYEMQVPFGVVHERDGLIEGIEEKPVQTFTVSAGIYVLSPSVVRLVPQSTYYDMPSLFGAAADAGLSTRCHHVNAYWLDIGRPPDFERANREFDEVFP